MPALLFSGVPMSREKNPLADPKARKAATLLVHGGTARSPFHETSEALFLNSGYTYDSSEAAESVFKNNGPGFIYSRFSNPTVEMFQQRMALLEGAEEARGTASGMAAVTTAVMAQVKAGDHAVAARALFGGCRFVIEEFLPRWGVASTLVDGRDPRNFERAMRPIALNRKNALFAGSDEGAEHWAILATLIECCKLHGVNPAVRVR